MIIRDEDMMLRPDDAIKKADWGGLVIERTIQLSVCRCRECEDACQALAGVPHLLCVHCNNHHTQLVNGEYKGPFLGPRRVLEHLAKIKPDPEPIPEPDPMALRKSLPGYLGGPPEACPICGSVPACHMDCR